MLFLRKSQSSDLCSCTDLGYINSKEKVSALKDEIDQDEQSSDDIFKFVVIFFVFSTVLIVSSEPLRVRALWPSRLNHVPQSSMTQMRASCILVLRTTALVSATKPKKGLSQF